MISKYIVFGLLSIIILCCILKKKEGYTILGDDKFIKIGNAFRADECQNECAKDPQCKYVNRPLKLKSWEKGECWKSGLYDQDITGAAEKGNFKKKMATWENINYVQPAESVYHSSIGGYRFKDRGSANNHCESNGLRLCTSDQVINNKKWNKKGDKTLNLCNSGWTTDKRGWWVGKAKNGCGSKSKTWKSWYKKGAGSSAHCCTKGYRR
tara:strand:- start:428 stop:1057 length:630 start_codon:yes stop_codon:yes gene_type:complete